MMTGSPWKPGGPSARPEGKSLLALILLIKIVGLVGFVGLLAASRYFRAAEYGCRVGALVWFAAFGIAYVLVSAKANDGGRRWP